MNPMRVLIVEDEPLIAMDLEAAVTETAPAVVIVKTSVADTLKVLPEPLDFAFLDVDVTNGKTYPLAHILSEKKVPFVFVSASSPQHLPAELRSVPFIPKPFDQAAIARFLKGLEAPAPV